MDKLIIIINGKGGSGKDTICSIVSKYTHSISISAITPIKDIARISGWTGEKDNKSRKFLSDLKKAFIDYNDLPLNYLLSEVKKFTTDDNKVLFVHIREPNEIDKFKLSVEIPVITLLVQRPSANIIFGNESDDFVDDYKYDYIFQNDTNSFAELENSVISFFESLKIIKRAVKKWTCKDKCVNSPS
jgi:hypothetical protein